MVIGISRISLSIPISACLQNPDFNKRDFKGAASVPIKTTSRTCKANNSCWSSIEHVNHDKPKRTLSSSCVSEGYLRIFLTGSLNLFCRGTVTVCFSSLPT
ncbi:Uncharacterised protein [Chlamydia abortus]|nr:Uncharacterised protein [Chlamydia abortus]